MSDKSSEKPTGSIRQMNRLSLLAQHSYAREHLSVSAHAAMRAETRSELEPEEVLHWVTQGLAIILPFKGRGCTYHLFYREALDAFFVAVVSADRSTYRGGKPGIITVLPVAAFEENGGEVSTRFRRTAVHLALGDERFREWDIRTYGTERFPSRLRVIAYFKQGDEAPVHKVFEHPPVCRAYVLTHGLENALGHPDVLPWLIRQITKADHDLDHLASLRIADTIKVELRIDAPSHPCPECARRRVQDAEAPQAAVSQVD